MLIDEVIKRSGYTIDDLHAVALSAGPGSYTGLRVGASCAKGICYAKNIPLLAVQTLELVAYQYSIQNPDASINYIIPTIDARRSEVYYAIYDSDLKECSPVDNHIIEENSFSGYPNAVICGDGALKASEIIKNDEIQYFNSFPEASFMSALAFRQYKAEKFENLAYYNPFYLKMPNITKSKKGILNPK